MSNHSEGGTPRTAAQAAGESTEQKIARLEHELAVARSALAEKERELESLRERDGIVSAAIELESYLARVNTQERQSIIFQVPDDDTHGVALAGFCERLTKLSKAIRCAAPPAGGEKP